jgi:hypothetical protein
MENPFKLIEPNATCPPEVREAVVSEIDLIRNALTVIELYTGDLFGTVSGMFTAQSDDIDLPTT